MSRTIPLSRGYVAVVDDADYEWLNQWKWHVLACSTLRYAVRTRRKSEYAVGHTSRTVFMHRALLGLGEANGVYVDHCNHDGLDNRRDNIRASTQGRNLGNQRKGAGSSQYKGVYWRADRRKWRAAIKVDGHYCMLGTHLDEKQAALAYDQAALEAWGSFAHLNFPDES